MPADTSHIINGLDTSALKGVMEAVSDDPSLGMVRFHVTTAWKGGTQTVSSVKSYNLGGQDIPRDFTIPIDEPTELLGTNTAPNPQEMLMSALNSCIMVGYIAGCSINGITLEHLSVETRGELDLRGFLGLDSTVKPGYNDIYYTVHIKGNGTTQQFQEIHQTVMATSPNYFNIANPVKINSSLMIE